MFKSQLEIIQDYELTIDNLKKVIEGLKVEIDRCSWIRLSLLLLEIAIFVSFLSVKNEVLVALFGVGLLLPVIGFIVIVKKQEKLTRQRQAENALLSVYENELNMLRGGVNSYDHGTDYQDQKHPFESDLDIFGSYSIYALLNRCLTRVGKSALAFSLNKEALLSEIRDKQQAVQEVFSHIQKTFAFRSNLKLSDLSSIDVIKSTLLSALPPSVAFCKLKVLQVYVKIVPFFTIALLLAAVIFGGPLWGIFALVAFFHFCLIFYFSKAINRLYLAFSGQSNLLAVYSEAILWTEQIDWKSDYIKGLFLTKEKISGSIKQLTTIIRDFDARLNMMLAVVLNIFFLWDLRCSIRLVKWHEHSATRVGLGLDRIGWFEELISLATLTYNFPTWNFPTLVEGFAFKSVGIGHPLISDSKRLSCDFDLRENPTVDIVTGSNMAGKSTFLRTVGVNMVLAYAGAPVCAKSLELSVFKIFTFMRIRDSLNESTSTFKAELNRLKLILDEVGKKFDAFVLIDEMLRGTNSKDKFLGSKAFIEKLIDLKIPTLFATHDLQLSELSLKFPDAVRNYHFDIQMEGGEMYFDYRLKEGPCSIFNASLLLKEIGLDLRED